VGPSEQQEDLFSDTVSTSSDDDEDGGEPSLLNQRSKRRRGRKKPRNKHKCAPQEPEGLVMTAISGNTVAITVGVFGEVSTTFMPDISDDHVPPHTDEPDDLYYFDASDKEKIVLGRAVHLNINYTQFLRESDVDALLTRQTDDDPYGRNQEFDSYAYALQSAKTKVTNRLLHTTMTMTILMNSPMPWRTSTNSLIPWMKFPLCRKIGTRALNIERYSRKSTTWPSNDFDFVLPCYHLQRSSKPWPTQRKWQKQYSLFQCDVIFDRGFHF
jgi:hypothetical protein